MTMKDEKLFEVFFPWRTWQEWGIVGLVVLITFMVYYVFLFPSVDRLYFSAFQRRETHPPLPQCGAQADGALTQPSGKVESKAAHQHQNDTLIGVPVEVLYFPYVASLANSEAWIIVRGQGEDSSVHAKVMLEVAPESAKADVRWGCGEESNAWICREKAPVMELTPSSVNVYRIRYTILPSQVQETNLSRLWWKQYPVAEFHLVRICDGFSKPWMKGKWIELYYDPWRVFWWQVVYRNLLWPPWGNFVVLAFALLLARVVTGYILVRGQGKVKDVLQKVVFEIPQFWQGLVLVVMVAIMNVVVFCVVWVFYRLISGDPGIWGDIGSMVLLIGILWGAFSRLVPFVWKDVVQWPLFSSR